MENNFGWSVQAKEERTKGKLWKRLAIYYIMVFFISLGLAGGGRLKWYQGILWGLFWGLAVIAVVFAAVLLLCFIRYQLDVHSPNGGRFLLKKLKETKQPQEYIEAMQKRMIKAQEKGKGEDYSVYAINMAYGLVCNAEFERAEALLDSLNMYTMSDNLRFICQEHKVSISIYKEDYEKAGKAIPDLHRYLNKMKDEESVKAELGRLVMFWEYLCTDRYNEALFMLDEIERTNTMMDTSYILMYRMRLAFRVGDTEKGRMLLEQLQTRKKFPVIDTILEQYRER